MSYQGLVQALQSVPFLTALGITVESAKPGEVTLRLPAVGENLDHASHIHSGALFSLGEAAAGVAVGTCPDLVGVLCLQKATGIKYTAPCTGHATATAQVPAAILEQLADPAQQGEKITGDIIVGITDEAGTPVAEVVAVYNFRK